MSQDNSDKRPSDRDGRSAGRRPDDRRGGKDFGGHGKSGYRGGDRGGSDRKGGKPYGSGGGHGKPRGGDRGDRPYRPKDGQGEHRGRSGDRRDGPKGDRPYRPRDDRRGSDGYRGKPHGDRPYRPKDGQGEHRGKPRDGNQYGRRDRPEGRHERPREDGGEERREPRLTIPSTPEKILFKGIDCEVNGKAGLAMKLYLHGAAKLSGGCESNAQRMLREMGAGEFGSVRGRMAQDSPEDVLVALDYLCATLDESYDVSFVQAQAEGGNPLAVYELIRLGRVEGDSPMIDAFASHADESPDMVRDGLKLLVRKKDSASAASQIKRMDERQKERQSVRPAFVRAMKGGSRKQLEELSASFPEAAFLLGYVDSQDRESYLRDGMQRYQSTIISMAAELGVSDTPFGKYLAAKKTQAQEGDWVMQMVNAAIAGSDDAVAELAPIRDRRDVRKGLASMYLARGDAAGLVSCYDGEDAEYLDRYCAGDPAKMVELARRMGTDRAIAWLKRGYLKGAEECREELVRMAGSGEYGCKQLIYALHDVGAELESAKLYMSLYGDKALPSVKWLAKVCSDEEAKEFLRQRFEELGEPGTFESIFVDDGYERKGPRKGGNPGKDRRHRSRTVGCAGSSPDDH